MTESRNEADKLGPGIGEQDGPPPLDIPLRAAVFMHLGSDELPKELFREILERKSELKPSTRARVEAGIRSDLKLQGFRDPSKAPNALLSAKGGAAFCFAEHLSAAVLGAWFELRSQLRTAMAAYLEGKGVPTAVPESFPAMVHPSVSFEEGRTLATGFLEASPDSSVEQASLMVFCLTAFAPRSQERDVTDTADTSSFASNESKAGAMPVLPAQFESLLAELAGMPCDLAVWDEVEPFVGRLRELASRKLEERLVQTHNLEDELVPIRDEYGPELTYLSMKDLMTWTAESFVGCDIGAVANALSKLSQVLAEVRAVRNRGCDTVEDDESRQRDLRAVVSRARGVFDILNQTKVPTEEISVFPAVVAVEETADADPGSPAPVEPETLLEPGDKPLPEPVVVPAEVASLAAVLTPVAVITEEEEEDKGEAGARLSEDRQPTPSLVLGESRKSEEALPPPESASAPATLESVPAMAATQPAARVPTSRPFPQDRLSSLSDEDLAMTVKDALRSSADLPQIDPRVYLDLQVRWLLRGQNLRACILARFMEKNLVVSWSESSTAAQGIPPWLCWVALIMSDSGALRLGYNIAELIPLVLGLDRASETLRRFFAVWLGVGLTGPSSEFAMHLVSNVRPKVWEGWADGRRIDRFLTQHVLDAARCGRRPQFTAGAPTRSRERYLAELAEAERVLTLPCNYSNAAIKRYWGSLVGTGGPTRELLAAVRKAQPGVVIPDPEELAGRVEGWRDIQSRYHNNILNRLSHFSGHLRTASSIRAALEAPVAKESTLSAPELAEALADGWDQARRFREQRSPIARGYEVLVDQLGSRTKGSGGEV